jgi:hypothetical protein
MVPSAVIWEQLVRYVIGCGAFEAGGSGPILWKSPKTSISAKGVGKRLTCAIYTLCCTMNRGVTRRYQ